MTTANPYGEFLDRYENDWVGIVRDVLGAEPDEQQAEVLTAVQNHERRISIRSGHGVGKTTVLAWCILCHILTRFPQKTVCTAPTKGQLFDALASEVKAWANKLPPAIHTLLEIKVERIELKSAPNESFIAFNTSRAETPEAMAGVHSENVLLVPDEASGVPDPVFESAAGSMSGHNATTLLAGNPVRTSGLFYDTHHSLKDKWRTIHISCEGHPRISDDFIEDMRLRYGRDSNAYRVRVLGEFPKGDDDTVIPRELAEWALARDVKPQEVRPTWGLSVARRLLSDPSALARRRGNVLQVETTVRQGMDPSQIAGWVKQEYDALQPTDRPSEINVDVLGFGAQVLDRLYELGLPARGTNVQERPAVFEQLYANMRTELVFRAKTWLERMDCHLAADADLVDQLCALRFKYANSGKMQVESQEDFKKDHPKLGAPTRAEAFLLSLASDSITAVHGSAASNGRGSWSQPLKRNVGVV